MSDLKKTQPTELARNQQIFLKAKDGTQYVKATFLQAGQTDFSASLEGSKTGFPFVAEEWDIFVEPTFPVPAQNDIEAVIYNLVAAGAVTGEAPNYGDMAQALIALIRGEVETPVPLFKAPEPLQVVEPREIIEDPDDAFDGEDDLLAGMD